MTHSTLGKSREIGWYGHLVLEDDGVDFRAGVQRRTRIASWYFLARAYKTTEEI
jgi:hypothetical protein